MKRILARRPSAALVIACVALFASLGGVSYGVATGFIDSREIKNNTIRTQDLRNNEVRGRDIRNSTIGGRDVALNTLTGSDINESKLGKVPSADSADSAGTAGKAASVDTQHPIPLTAVAEGSTATLASYDPFTVTGTCAPGGGGSTDAGITVATSESGSATATDRDFGPADGAVSVVAPTASTNDSAGGDPNLNDYTFSASAPSGRAFTAVVSALADADAGASGVCRFHGTVTVDG